MSEEASSKEIKILGTSVEDSVAQMLMNECENPEFQNDASCLTYKDSNGESTNKTFMIFYIFGSLIIILLLVFVINRLLNFNKLQSVEKNEDVNDEE